MTKKRIYLDNNATTRPSSEVVESVVLELNSFGNPSSAHHEGQIAKAHLANARDNVANFFKVKHEEIVFTSSGSEAINMLLRGFFGYNPSGHIVTTDLEHASLYYTVQALERSGCTATYVSPGVSGAPTKEQIEAAISKDTKLIALIGANNETGCLSPIAEIAELALKREIPLIVDYVQLLGKEKIEIPEGVSALAFSGHKIHAPKGVGFAIVKRGFQLIPYITGGPQESSRRGGTENIPSIVGLSTALDLLKICGPEAHTRMRELRDLFEGKITGELKDVLINGEGPRICNTSNLAFLGIHGEDLLRCLDIEGLSSSHGAACATGAVEPSRILLNMGFSRKRAISSLRFSLSRETTEDEIEEAIKIVVKTVNKLRSLA